VLLIVSIEVLIGFRIGYRYTVFGPEGVLDEPEHPISDELPGQAGIVLRACREALIAIRGIHKDVKLQLSVQYVQIYQEEVTDLISGGVVILRQGPHRADLRGCSEHEIHTMSDVLHLLRIGEERKVDCVSETARVCVCVCGYWPRL
jgi:hypothetical protein